MDARAVVDADADAASRTLWIACFYGEHEEVLLLLRSGADPNRAANSSPLFVAAQNGSLDIAALLLAHGADPNQPSADVGDTPLVVASSQGHADVVSLLLAHGADPNRATTATGCTPLLAASTGGHAAVARQLLEAGVDPDQAGTDEDAATPLHEACRAGHPRVAQLLGTFGARMSADSWLPHVVARLNGHADLAAWLNEVAEWPQFRLAVACRHHAAARRLLRTGGMADPTLCALEDVQAAAASAAPWGDGNGLPAPPACAGTRRLAREAMARWSPSRHWLHHAAFREAVRAVLLVAQRLDTHGGGQPPWGQAAPTLRVLPPELWLHICGWLLRRHWPV